MRYVFIVLVCLLTCLGAYFLIRMVTDDTFFRVFIVLMAAIIYGIHYTMIYDYEAIIREEQDDAIIQTEDRIPVIGGKKVDWNEYRDIPDFPKNGRIKFNRDKL